MNNRPQKQSMAELKLRRVTEHIQRLRDDLARPRVRVSEAAQSLIRYTRTTKDPLVCFFSLSLIVHVVWLAYLNERLFRDSLGLSRRLR